MNIIKTNAWLAIPLISLLGLLTIPFTPVSAQPVSCEALYSVAPVASDDAKSRAVALLSACRQGYETNECAGFQTGKHATKAEKILACNKGRDYRAVNPPDGGSNLTGCEKLEDAGGTSLIDCNTKTGNPVLEMMFTIINFLAFGVGLAVVGGIIWGGLIYASSNGDSSKVQQAKAIIANSVIGLLLFIFMYAIINFLVPGGLFT